MDSGMKLGKIPCGRYKSQKPREIEGREEADGPMAVTDAMADTSSSACCEFS